MNGLSLAAALAAVAASALIGSLAALGAPPTLPFRVPGPPPASRVHRWLDGLGASVLGRRVGRGRLDRLRAAAGARWTLDELIGTKLVGASFVAIAALISPSPPLLVPLLLVVWRAPELVLARLARRRVAAASREVPLFLDLLAVATSAGLAPQLAVRTAATPLVGPLAEDLDQAVARVDLGARWRDELGGVAERLSLPDLHRAAAVLGRSEALGSALAAEVGRLAGDVREARRARATERARTAPVKMLFPLVFLILPAFLLLTVVPVLLTTVRSIG